MDILIRFWDGRNPVTNLYWRDPVLGYIFTVTRIRIRNLQDPYHNVNSIEMGVISLHTIFNEKYHKTQRERIIDQMFNG